MNPGSEFITTYLIQQEYEQGNIDQQFKLNEDDQLESVKHPGKYMTESNTGCEGAIGLGLKRASPQAYQEWRSHPHGLVMRRYEEKCQYGDSTFTSIKENSFENITSFEPISFWFVNDALGEALTVRVSSSHV